MQNMRMNLRLHSAAIVLLTFMLNGCAGWRTLTPDELEPLTTNGCSLVPDGQMLPCCTGHDVDYWRGGTADERKTADQRFMMCVESTTGSRAFSQLAYHGVRVGGNPWLPPSAGWGYGWRFGRGYAPLDPNEQQRAAELMASSLAESSASCQEGDKAACLLAATLQARTGSGTGGTVAAD